MDGSKTKHNGPILPFQDGRSFAVFLTIYLFFKLFDPVVVHYTQKHVWEHWNDGRIEMIKDYQSIFEE